MKNYKLPKQLYKNTCLLLILFSLSVNTIGCSELSQNTTTYEKDDIQLNTEDGKATDENIPTEYKAALRKAKLYNDTINMSKASLYNQLTAEYGENFSAEAAEYAIDNLNADWKANALKKAQIYKDAMSMSPNTIYEHLTSEYSERFTSEEAEYAINNLK